MRTPIQKLFLGLLSAVSLSALPANAALISIIDSGTDLGHPMLAGKAWNNPADPDDAIDNDDNGYVDDTHGWNFAENNNRLYEKKLLGKFPREVYEFFDVQIRILMGKATPADLDWMKSKRTDGAFIAKLGTFGNWVHGTHVAGIAARASDAAQVMPLKILPTQAASVLNSSHLAFDGAESLDSDAREWLVRKGLALLAGQQGKVFEPVGKYVKDHRARVANCSFGSSVSALKPTLKPLLDAIMGRTLTDAEATVYLSYFIQEAMKSMNGNLVKKSPNTLFVFAAGNDGTDNDVLPTAPANIKADNTITVAASLGTERLASFSNTGAQMVDLAAPGVGIESSIPGGAKLLLSGTSQAAPFVAGLAGRILDTNPKLAPADVKRILLETVDRKEWLRGKVATSGTANPDRAVLAAKLSLTLPLAAAIDSASRSVGEWKPAGLAPQSEGFVVPMMPLVE